MTAPKISKEGIASAKFEILQSTNNIMANKIPAGINTLLQPNLEAAAPEIGIVKSDPMPMQRSNIPNTSSPIARRSRNIGTSGAHEAAPNPPTKNIARVECRCSFCTFCGDMNLFEGREINLNIKHFLRIENWTIFADFAATINGINRT